MEAQRALSLPAENVVLKDRSKRIILLITVFAIAILASVKVFLDIPWGIRTMFMGPGRPLRWIFRMESFTARYTRRPMDTGAPGSSPCFSLSMHRRRIDDNERGRIIW